MFRFLSLGLAVALLSTACGDDDESVTVTNESIAGTWQLTGGTSESTTTTSLGGQDITLTATGDIQESTAEVTFEEDGTYSTTGSYVYVITSAGQTQQQVLNFDGQRGTYEASGNQVTFRGPGLAPSGETITSTETTTTVTAFVPGSRLSLELQLDSTLTIAGTGSIDIKGASRVNFVQ